jgi:RNA polymerase sigma factor (sigma-70 family)
MQSLANSVLSYRPYVYRYLRGRVRSADDAEDLTQEVLYRALKGVSGLRNPKYLRTWIHSIARHELCNYIRRYRRKITEVTLSEEEWQILDQQPDPRALDMLNLVELLADYARADPVR